MNKNKIVLFFPDGVGVRNYLYSNVFIDNKAHLTLLHKFDNQTITNFRNKLKIDEDVVIPKYKENFPEKFFRELICLLRLLRNSKTQNNSTILTNWNWNQKKVSNKIFYKFIQFIAFFLKSYNSILFLEKEYQKLIRKTDFYNKVKILLEEINPNFIFCSHQRALQAAPIFAAANDLGIKTVTVIFSWDNLPKARLALRADKYLVWSDYMKNEMKIYYPEIEQEKVIVTGTPQFEFYNDKSNIIDKELFYKKYNLDTTKKIICFSGDDHKTSPDDPKYLDDVANEIKKNNLQNEYQILFRRCPVDLSGRFETVVKKHIDLIKEAPPKWIFNEDKTWTSILPSIEDVKLLVSTAFYSDVVINVGSTMAFDFAMYNKPCIFINYDQEEQLDTNWSVKTIYKFQHFRSMPSENAVFWLNNRNEIIKTINSALKMNKNDQMMNWKDIIIQDFSNASIKINKELLITN